ncbi:MAG TPA: nuclear transport factor 2 family protein [Solirubrobacterales bacterium]|nr:nuclear transport factor 2 family protein [Solirubrobacterales bacterium]
MGAEENKAAVERVWQAFDAREFERASEELHEDFVCEWPHSGERIRGRDAYIAVNRGHPDPWVSIEILRLLAEGEVVVSEVRLPVEGAEPHYALSFWEFRDGRAARLTEYWVQENSQEPYEYRAGISEPL